MRRRHAPASFPETMHRCKFRLDPVLPNVHRYVLETRMQGMTRREMLAATAGAAALAALDVAPSPTRAGSPAPPPGHLKQSVCRWPFESLPLPEFCRAAKAMGLVAIDLLQPDEWPVAREAGLICSMGYPSRRRDFIATGFNDRANHDLLVQELTRHDSAGGARRRPQPDRDVRQPGRPQRRGRGRGVHRRACAAWRRWPKRRGSPFASSS